VSLYAPDREYGSWVGFGGMSSFPMVFLVRIAILRFCSSEDVSNVRSFFADVRERGLFWGVIGLFVCVGLMV
jgi:hypothetical protein